MGAGAVKNYFAVDIINAVNKKPIRFYMTFPFTLVFPMQGMVFVSWKQSLFVDQQRYYFSKFMHILAALLHQFAFFFEKASKSRF